MKNKKVIAMLMVATMMLSMTACADRPDEPFMDKPVVDSTTESVEGNNTETIDDSFGGFAKDEFGVDTETDEDTDSVVEKPDVTFAQQLKEQFQAEVINDTDIKSLANRLASNAGFSDVAIDVTSIEEGWLPGFSEDITGFTEGYTFGPIVSTIPFIGYVFELDSKDSVDTFTEDLQNKANLRWNVCTEADEMIITSYDNVVFFVMSPYSFED